MKRTDDPRESVIERHFVRVVEDLGGMAQKYKSPARKNAPDRLALMPYAVIVFVELKRRGEDANDGQKREHARLRLLGFRVDVLDSYEAVDRWATDMCITIHNIASATR